MNILKVILLIAAIISIGGYVFMMFLAAYDGKEKGKLLRKNLILLFVVSMITFILI